MKIVSLITQVFRDTKQKVYVLSHPAFQLHQKAKHGTSMHAFDCINYLRHDAWYMTKSKCLEIENPMDGLRQLYEGYLQSKIEQEENSMPSRQT